MESLETLRQQHTRIIEVFDEVAELLDATRLPAEAEQACTLLERLEIQLAEHLRLEDDFLYPALEMRSQKVVRETATRFAEELGGLRLAFAGYRERWPTADSIRLEPDAFVEQTRTVAEALRERIAKEDSRLFPLLEEHRFTTDDLSLWIDDWNRICLLAADTRGGPVGMTAEQAREVGEHLYRYADLLAEQTDEQSNG